MITLIILLVLIITGILIFLKSYYYDFLGVVLAVFSGILFVSHLVLILTATYNYEVFVVEREAFESTLHNARKNGNQYETATIVKEVSNWNIALARYKYDNSTLFFGQFIDDRIESLEPIK